MCVCVCVWGGGGGGGGGEIISDLTVYHQSLTILSDNFSNIKVIFPDITKSSCGFQIFYAVLFNKLTDLSQLYLCIIMLTEIDEVSITKLIVSSTQACFIAQ